MRELRRKDKQIDFEDAQELLTVSEYGVLSTVDNNGQPYGVPLNYVYTDGVIYFHCALSGHKIDNIKSNPKVSFSVVAETEVLPEEFSTNFASTIVFGVASEALGEERHIALMGLLEKYSPDYLQEGREYIKKLDKVTKVIKIDIQHTSGKVAPAKASR